MEQGTAKIDAERSGVPASPTPPAPLGTALGLLSAVLDHDGQQISATQTRHQALAEADHLTVLHAIWTAETTPGRLPNALVSDGQWLGSCQSVISSRRLSKAALKLSRWKRIYTMPEIFENSSTPSSISNITLLRPYFP
jgi:hypothetical protein